MPPNFQFQFWSGPRQLWVPAGWTKGDQERSSNSFICIGRLKPAVSLAEARSEMDIIGGALAQEYPNENSGQTVRVIPMSEYGARDLRPALVAMLAIVGLVLLIACVNVANLMLARATVRQRELAIRCALGAGRGRIMRQLLTESVLLALLGGDTGLLVALWGTSLLLPVLPDILRVVPFRPLDRVDVDASVLAFTFAVSFLSGVLFGLVPALGSFRSDLNHPLKEDGRDRADCPRRRLAVAGWRGHRRQLRPGATGFVAAEEPARARLSSADATNEYRPTVARRSSGTAESRGRRRW